MPPLVFEILVALQPLARSASTETVFLPKGNLRGKPCVELWNWLSSVSSTFLGSKAKGSHMVGKRPAGVGHEFQNHKAKTPQTLRSHGLPQL